MTRAAAAIAEVLGGRKVLGKNIKKPDDLADSSVKAYRQVLSRCWQSDSIFAIQSCRRSLEFHGAHSRGA